MVNLIIAVSSVRSFVGITAQNAELGAVATVLAGYGGVKRIGVPLSGSIIESGAPSAIEDGLVGADRDLAGNLYVRSVSLCRKGHWTVTSLLGSDTLHRMIGFSEIARSVRLTKGTAKDIRRDVNDRFRVAADAVDQWLRKAGGPAMASVISQPFLGLDAMWAGGLNAAVDMVGDLDLDREKFRAAWNVFYNDRLVPEVLEAVKRKKGPPVLLLDASMVERLPAKVKDRAEIRSVATRGDADPFQSLLR